MIRWRAWGSAAVAEAAGAGLPLALLIVDPLDHFSTSWRESLADDEDLSALLGSAFVPVLADRWEHPALAVRSQEILALSSDAAGYPCLAILVPDGGRPPPWLGAVPWLPLRDRDGIKGLARVLVESAQAWEDDAADLLRQAHGLGQTLHAAAFAGDGSPDPRWHADRLGDLAEASLMAQADTLNGGFGKDAGGAPRLPRVPDAGSLRLLAARCRRPGAAPSLREHLDRSLAALAAGGIHDQLLGGFHRAATDAGWMLPCFEKRLRDQALLAIAFLDGADALSRPVWREVAERTLRWTVAALRREDGWYAHGLHADSEAPDGRMLAGGSCTWTPDELAAVIGADGARAIARRFGVTSAGDAAGRSVLAVRAEADDRDRLPALCRRLAVARSERTGPRRDDRALLHEQGLLLAAFASAARRPDPDGDLIQAGRELASLVAGCPGGGPDARDAPWLAIGLQSWDAADPRPGGWLEASGGGDAAIAADPLLDPPAFGLADDADGPGVLGSRALALAALGRRDALAALAGRHARWISRAPLAAASVLLALEPPA